MKRSQSFINRILAGAGLAAVVLGAAAVGGPVAGADPTPPLRAIPATFAASLSPIQVTVGAHDATATFTSSEPTVVSYELKLVSATPPAQPPRGPLGNVANPLGSAGTIATDPPAAPAYNTKYQLHLTPLKSATTYDLFVAATTRSGQRLTAQTRFTTLRERVRVTLESIDIQDDGDSFLRGDGEPRWTMDVAWGANKSRQCYPITCGSFGNFGEGRIVPHDANGNRLAWVFTEEIYTPLPKALTISVQAEEDDGFFAGSPSQISTATAECRLPGTEAVSTRVQVRGDEESRGFRSLLTFTCDRFFDATNGGLQ